MPAAPPQCIHCAATRRVKAEAMSEYGSQLLLRRVSLSCKVRIRVEHHFDETIEGEVWTVCAFDDASDRTWRIQENNLDGAARALARTLGVFLPSDQLRERHPHAQRGRRRPH